MRSDEEELYQRFTRALTEKWLTKFDELMSIPTEMKTKEELEHLLATCTGTEHYYKHMMGRLHYTDGVAMLAEEAQCYWLIDAIASYQYNIRPDIYQVWYLTVEDSKALLVMKVGEHVQIRQDILFTTFPLDEIKLICYQGVLCLPSED